jgi:hypothetical protein
MSNVISARDGVVGIESQFMCIGQRVLDPGMTVVPGNPTICHQIMSQTNVYPAALFQGDVTWTPSAGNFPTQTQYGGPLKANYTWQAADAGTVAGVPVAKYQVVRALVDNPGQDAANWAVTGAANIPSVSTFGTLTLGLNTVQTTIEAGQQVLAPKRVKQGRRCVPPRRLSDRQARSWSRHNAALPNALLDEF